MTAPGKYPQSTSSPRAMLSSSLDESNESNSLARIGMLDADWFLKVIDDRIDESARRGTVASIEIRGLNDDASIKSDALSQSSISAFDAGLREQLEEEIGHHGVFCWHGGRLLVLLDQSAKGTAHRTLRKIGQSIATFESGTDHKPIHLTPAIGYVDLRQAKSAQHLWTMIEGALDRAKSSLEIEPIRYVRGPDAVQRRYLPTNPLKLWGRVPQWFQLSAQLVISLILGFGAPFILYAVCDALGVDISGPVYIGVVIVLLITATLIWVEGFLALKATEPPAEPASPYPIATIVIPAYLPNEADTIVETVKAFLRLEYANTVQIIIAYNSPKPMPVEDELAALAACEARGDHFIIEPIRVIGSTSKAQNVNAVIGQVKGRFVGIFDADHHPHSDSVERAWRWLSNGWDIVQGRCAIRNGDDSWVSRMAAVEFEQIYAVSHPGRARLHGFGIFGGSNGFWRTSVLHETRMRHSMLTEDIDSSIRAVMAGYKIVGDRNLISEELAPTSLHQLLNQRLRWAQGWFQVSYRRVLPALVSPHVSIRQKLGLIHLLVWRELFPWYSIQVVPIMIYWVWIYGWSHIQWTIPIFLFTTIYTLSTGPGQILLAYKLAQKSMRRRPGWFLEYLFVSMLFYSPFKDTLSRIAHIKEAMRERAWKVTPRAAPTAEPRRRWASATAIALAAIAVLLAFLSPAIAKAETADSAKQRGFSFEQIKTLLGGEASTIHAARTAARDGRNAEAANLFAKAIAAVPSRRRELLPEYARALTYSNSSGQAIPLYRELLALPLSGAEKNDTLSYYAQALTSAGQYQSALAAYNILLNRTSGNADVAVRRARVLTALGRPADAVAALDRVVPANWATGSLAKLGDEVLVDAARSAAKAGKLAAADHLYDRAIRHNGALRASLAREYAEQLVGAGRTADAIPVYREAIDDRSVQGTGWTTAVFGLAQAMAKSGQRSEAYKAYTLGLAQGPSIDRSKPFATLLAQSSTRTNVAIILKSSGIAADQLATAARMAAAAGQSKDSSALLKKAIAECNGCQRRGLQQYTDQLAGSAGPKESIALYRATLARLSPGTEGYKKAQRGLALVLTQTEGSRKALDTWTSYLQSSPRDVDALLHQARLFSAVRENGKALDVYRVASGIDPRNAIAQRGIVDETINLARLAARTDRNADAALLFASAFKLDGNRRMPLLREYSDQLSFGGRAPEAIPLYREVLAGKTLSPQDRKQAWIGLANAYAWAGRSGDALAAYTEIALAYPQDADIQWTRLVFAARHAAQTNRNVEAAGLFSQAIEARPDRRTGLLREYADQLTFAAKAVSAIPLYAEFLAQPTLAETDRWAARKGLAQAYDWSGRFADAKEAYGALIEKYPNEISWRWKLLVVSGRESARADLNKKASTFFAKAIELNPEHSAGILREYADQLCFTGRSANAIGFYAMVLNQPGLKDSERLSAQKGLAQAYDWSGRFTEAKATYGALSQLDPTNVSLRWQLLVVSAREAGQADRNKEAASLYLDAIHLVPSRRTEILKEYADKLTFSGGAKQAIPLYRELIARDRNPADLRSHELSLALSLAWNNQSIESLRLYQRLAAADPKDIDAQSGVAQMLSWGGNQTAAKIVFEKILVLDPKNAIAQRGIAQAEIWQGHHFTAQNMLAQLLKADPDDLEARRLLAQSQFWSGRPDKAMGELKVALQGSLPVLPNRPGTQVASAQGELQPPSQRGPLQRVEFQGPDRPTYLPK